MRYRSVGQNVGQSPGSQRGIDLATVPDSATALAQSMGTAAAELDVIEASYLIGVLYTAMMPGKLRAELGAYYTPPALCERLLDMATEAGVDCARCGSSTPLAAAGHSCRQWPAVWQPVWRAAA